MMTSVLRDSLGGNCKTVMVATVSPEAPQTEESISTCQFAQRVALVKVSTLVYWIDQCGSCFAFINHC